MTAARNAKREIVIGIGVCACVSLVTTQGVSVTGATIATGETTPRWDPPPIPRISGPYVTVFNASVATCGAHGRDNVDSPARAFLDDKVCVCVCVCVCQ